MKILKFDRKGIALIEITLILVISLLFASWIVRIFYAHGIHEWEDGIYKSIGIGPGIARFVIGVAALSIFIIIAIKRGRARSRKSRLD